jgi:hypothetical protein
MSSRSTTPFPLPPLPPTGHLPPTTTATSAVLISRVAVLADLAAFSVTAAAHLTAITDAARAEPMLISGIKYSHMKGISRIWEYSIIQYLRDTNPMTSAVWQANLREYLPPSSPINIGEGTVPARAITATLGGINPKSGSGGIAVLAYLAGISTTAAADLTALSDAAQVDPTLVDTEFTDDAWQTKLREYLRDTSLTTSIAWQAKLSEYLRDTSSSTTNAARQANIDHYIPGLYPPPLPGYAQEWARC